MTVGNVLLSPVWAFVVVLAVCVCVSVCDSSEFVSH